MTDTSRRATFWAAASALAAIVAAVFAGFAYFGQGQANHIAVAANSTAAAANDIAQQGLDLARKNDARIDRQNAEGVALGNVAPDAKHQLPANSLSGVRVWFVVYNSTTRPIENVWVADAHGGSIRIQGIEPCMLYYLAAGFEPTDLYFSDADGLYWHRAYGGAPQPLTKAQFPPMPNPDTSESPWNVPLEHCAGG